MDVRSKCELGATVLDRVDARRWLRTTGYAWVCVLYPNRITEGDWQTWIDRGCRKVRFNASHHFAD